jgi:hypothetical protein
MPKQAMCEQIVRLAPCSARKPLLLCARNGRCSSFSLARHALNYPIEAMQWLADLPCAGLNATSPEQAHA